MQKKPKKEQKARKAVDFEPYNPNVVKVKNKLVGNVEKADLYMSDDDLRREVDDYPTANQKLDLNLGPQVPKITTSTFLAKIKKQSDGKDDLSKQI